MIVISDTSPLNYLVLIHEIEVLPHLFGEVHAPASVIQELQHSRAPEPVKLWAQSIPIWLHVNRSASTMNLDPTLDLGEAEALALAQKLRADAILIDERKGRRTAQAQGFRTLGTITILELASEQKLLDLPTALSALSQTTFHCSQAIIDAALARDTARRQTK